MDELELELQKALGRREPSADFAGRVLARLEPRPKPARAAWRPAAMGALAAGLAAMTFGLYQYREYQRGIEAKRQLMVALEITAEKLHVAQDTVNQKQRKQRP